MTLPRVSIAIPTYNQPEFIGVAVRSALMQDYPNLEVIVADDASTDARVPAALESFRNDERLRIVTNEQNLGRVGNYRRALHEHMTGEWALMLDGDDYLLDPSYVSNAIEQATCNYKIVLVFGGCRMLAGTRYRDHLQAKLRGESNVSADAAWQIIAGRDYFLQWGVWLGVPHQSALYRRDLALQLDFYRHDIISSDWESLRRLVLNGRVIFCRRPVAAWRRHPAGASNDVRLESRIADLRSITEPCLYAKSLGVDELALDQWRSKTLADYAIDTYRVGLVQSQAVDVEPLLAAISQIDSLAAQRAHQVIAHSPSYVARRMLRNMLGHKRFRRVLAQAQALTWNGITQ